MKFYSETLNKLFDSEKECNKAEKEALAAEEAKKNAIEKKNAERKIDSEKVQAAFKKMKEATDAYEEELSKFCDKYGAYHTSMRSEDIDDFFRLFRLF